jgi:hypothetical protein
VGVLNKIHPVTCARPPHLGLASRSPPPLPIPVGIRPLHRWISCAISGDAWRDSRERSFCFGAQSAWRVPDQCVAGCCHCDSNGGN